MSVVLVQCYRFRACDRSVWRNYSLEWLKHGYRVLFWTNWDIPPHGLDSIPFAMQRKTGLVKQNPDLLANGFSEMHQRWSRRCELQERDYGRPEWTFDPEATLAEHLTIFETVRPSIYLNFGGGDLATGSARDAASKMGIPSIVLEKGYFGPTKMLDTGGILGLSELCDSLLEDLIPNRVRGELSNKGAKYLSNYLKTFVPRPNHQSGNHRTTELPAFRGVRILVVGSLDRCTGFSYPGELKDKSIPGYLDGLDIAVQVAKRTDGFVVYKPHPNEDPKVSWTTVPPNLLISWADIRNAVDWADVVVGYGSGVDVLPVAMGKPFVLAGRSFMSNKGLGLDALFPKDLPAAIETALRDKARLEESRKNLESFVGYLLDDFLYNDYQDGPATRHFNESVPKILSTVGLAKDSNQSIARSILANRVKGVLTPKGIAKAKELRVRDRSERNAIPSNLAVRKISDIFSVSQEGVVALIDPFCFVSREAFDKCFREAVQRIPGSRMLRLSERWKGARLRVSELKFFRTMRWFPDRVISRFKPILDEMKELIVKIRRSGASVVFLDESGRIYDGGKACDWFELIQVLVSLRHGSRDSSDSEALIDFEAVRGILIGRPTVASGCYLNVCQRIFVRPIEA